VLSVRAPRLAWLGSGTLASRGLGVAGGAAVRGGIAVAPALLVGGLALSSEGEKALTRAAEHEADVFHLDQPALLPVMPSPLLSSERLGRLRSPGVGDSGVAPLDRG
jgi:hypothetical protein